MLVSVIPAGTIQIATQGEGVPGLHTLTMSNAATAGSAIVQYAQGQDTQFFVPGKYVYFLPRDFSCHDQDQTFIHVIFL